MILIITHGGCTWRNDCLVVSLSHVSHLSHVLQVIMYTLNPCVMTVAPVEQVK